MLKKQIIVLTLFLLSFCMLMQAQSDDTVVQKFEIRSHTFQNTTLPYRIFIPENYDSSKSYPLLLCLHGAGERGSDNEIQISKHALATAWAKQEVQQKYPSIIIAPQCPKKRKWSYTDFGGGSYKIDSVSIGKEMLTVVNLIDTVLEEFNIDENRQYVTGISMGGYGTWDIISRYPERFAAAAPMSGAGDPSKVALFKNLPIWNFHNKSDKIVPVSGSHEMLTAMKSIGLNVVETLGMSNKKIKKKINKRAIHIYTENPEGNHGPWEQWCGSTNLHNWMFLQSR